MRLPLLPVRKRRILWPVSPDVERNRRRLGSMEGEPPRSGGSGEYNKLEVESDAKKANARRGWTRSAAGCRAGYRASRVRGRIRCEQAGELQGNGHQDGMDQSPHVAARGREEGGGNRGELG